MGDKETIIKELIATGSNGTKIYEAIWKSRNVAIKYIPRRLQSKSLAEINAYQQHDKCQQIMRHFDDTEDHDHYNVVLERAKCSLSELIEACKRENRVSRHPNKERANFLRMTHKNFPLRCANGFPTPLLLKLIRDIMEAVMYLHKNNVRHQYLNPYDILICEETSQYGLCAKFSSLSYCSSSSPYIGTGGPGWKSPEQVCGKSGEIKSNLFVLGLVIFYCMTREHAFGVLDNLPECEENIKINNSRISESGIYKEGRNFINQILHPIPENRANLSSLLSHPIFWDSTEKRNFACELSNLIVSFKPSSAEIQYLEKKYLRVWGFGVGWDVVIDEKFSDHIYDHNGDPLYNVWSLKELVRFVRNMLQHYDEFEKPEKRIGKSAAKVYELIVKPIPDFSAGRTF